MKKEIRTIPTSELTKPVIIAALVIGGSILAGAWMVQFSLERTASSLDEIRTNLTQTRVALETVARGQGQPQQAAPARRGPDPNRRYSIKNDGAPAKGPATAKVRIFEFSDFQ